MRCDQMPRRPSSDCAECGMWCEPDEYHPYAACLMFKACGNSKTVRDNLEAVMDHARAAREGGAIVRESEAQVPVAATLDEAAADPALTLDVARELLRDAAAGIRSLAASATSEPDADLELIWHSVSDNAETNAAYRRLKARLAALNPKRRESECPWGGCGDCVGHEVIQPAGDGFPPDLHPRTADLVRRFAVALAERDQLAAENARLREAFFNRRD